MASAVAERKNIRVDASWRRTDCINSVMARSVGVTPMSSAPTYARQSASRGKVGPMGIHFLSDV
jgi:ribosomal protein L32E